MPKIIQIEVFTFDELTDPKAKDKARDWYRQDFGYWWQFIYEDAERIGLKIVGLKIDGFDDYDYGAYGHLTKSVEEVCKSILLEHGATCSTHVLASVTYGSLTRCREKRLREDQREEIQTEFTKELLKAYRKMLIEEWAYLNSDESVDEGIRANGYTFTKDGKRFDLI